MDTLGERLRRVRKEKGITQTKLESITGIPKKAISHYELNRRIPTFENLMKLADYFNTSIDWLLGRTEGRTSIIAKDVIKEEYGEDVIIILDAYKKMNDEEKAKLLYILKINFDKYFTDNSEEEESKLYIKDVDKQEIVDNYIKLCYELGKVATKDDVRKCTYICSPDKITYMFGSWTNFVKETNICKNGESVGKPLKEAVEQVLIKKRVELGRRLEGIEFNKKNDLPSVRYVRRLYGWKPLKCIWNELEEKYKIIK